MPPTFNTFVVFGRWLPFDVGAASWAGGAVLGVGRQLQGAVEEEDRQEDDDVEDGEHAANLAGGLLRLWILHAGVLDVEVPAPVGEHDGQRAGEEGDDPDARLAVAAVQEADQGEEEEEAEEDVEIPLMGMLVSNCARQLRMCGRVSPLKPELIDGRLTEHVELQES